MRCLIVFLFSVVVISPASADDRAEAQKHYIKGTKAFDLGAYDEAIAEYSAAYRIKDDPALLYNLGQAHRLANHPSEAIHFYRMYLTKVPDASNRDEVLAKIAEMQTVAAQQQAAERHRIEQQQHGAPPQAAMTSPPPPAHPAGVSISTRPEETSSRRGLIISGASLIGIGVAAIGGGIACGILAQKNADDLTRLGQTMQAFDSSKQSAGKTEQILEGTLLGIGGAAAVTGIVLVLLGRSASRGIRHAAITPFIGFHVAGAVTQVQF